MRPDVIIRFLVIERNNHNNFQLKRLYKKMYTNLHYFMFYVQEKCRNA